MIVHTQLAKIFKDAKFLLMSVVKWIYTYTAVPWHPRGIGSSTPAIPKSADAQVPYIKRCSIVCSPYLQILHPQVWRANCTI